MDTLVLFVDILVYALTVAIFARVLVSWIAMGSGSNNPLVAFIYQVTEPILAPIRRVLPRTGAIDLSPMVALVLLWLLQRLVRLVA
jgi:YggT family protein